MRSCKRTIWESKNRNNKEEESHTHHASPNIFLAVRLIPYKCEIHRAEDGHGQQGDGVRLVEEVQRDIVHRPFVYVLKLIDFRRVSTGMGRGTAFQRRRRWRSFFHPAAFQHDNAVRKVLLLLVLCF